MAAFFILKNHQFTPVKISPTCDIVSSPFLIDLTSIEARFIFVAFENRSICPPASFRLRSFAVVALCADIQGLHRDE